MTAPLYKSKLLFLILLIYYYSRADVIRAEKGMKSIFDPKGRLFLLFYAFPAFSESPLIVPLSTPTLGKGFDKPFAPKC